MMLHDVRQAAGRARRAMFPSREKAAWQQACRVARRMPRYQPGEIELAGYHIGYTDLLSVCPQWHDLFVRDTLRFESRHPAPRIVDCGANIGLASLYFKRLYPSSRITAYEADPTLADLARRNLARNGAADVDVRHGAVWTTGGEVPFRVEGADSGAVEGTSHGLVGRIMQVPAVRLRDVLAAEPVDLLKLDIEGAEAAVLADCEAALGNVNALVLDLHEFDSARRQSPAILSLLGRAGFTYALSDLMELPWRGRATAATPFDGRASAWAVTVRAWRSL